jgi:hypothetical protein
MHHKMGLPETQARLAHHRAAFECPQAAPRSGSGSGSARPACCARWGSARRKTRRQRHQLRRPTSRQARSSNRRSRRRRRCRPKRRQRRHRQTRMAKSSKIETGIETETGAVGMMRPDTDLGAGAGAAAAARRPRRAASGGGTAGAGRHGDRHLKGGPGATALRHTFVNPIEMLVLQFGSAARSGGVHLAAVLSHHWYSWLHRLLRDQ